LTPDATRLLAVHSEASSLSVFDVTNPVPVRVAEIPVGLEPVSVRARTNDEAWVVNEVSDTVSVVSLASGQVTAVLPTGDEPADVVFANGKAFVTCARDNEIWVYDAVTRALITTLEVQGLYPQSLAVSEDGSRVYAVFLHSGNGTTVLKRQLAPAPPAPTNTALPEAPNTALIVAATDPRINYTVLDHDVVEIDAATNQVLRYVSAVGTNLLGAAVRPGANELWVSNTEALNLVRFEPQLKGRFSLNRLSVVDLSTGSVEPKDLNPGVDYDVLPNPVAQSMALAQPSAVVFNTSGATAWTAAFASDRVAKVDAATGAVIERVDVRTGGGDSGDMRGPRGLALDENAGRLYVLNKLAETVSVIDVNSAVSTVVAEVDLSSHEPLPTQVKEGRGYLYDARLSGNGTVSCGVCHLDGDRDGLAWDLGDPGGQMQTVLGANRSAHDFTLRPRTLHPMKGPMTTQTLRGMQDGAPFHWRGDKPGIEDFNSTFPNLMGGELIDDADMEAMIAYLMTLRHHPNPNRNLDRSLPSSFGGRNPVEGLALYKDHVKGHCLDCHVLPTGSDNNLDLMAESGLAQPMKTPPLRTVYQRLFLDPRPGAVSLSGYGLLHDGTGFEMPIGHPYPLANLDLEELHDVAAFMMCFDTGVGLMVGHTQWVDAGNRGQSGVASKLALMEARTRAVPPDCDLVVRGKRGGEARRWLFDRATQTYRSDRAADAPLSRVDLLAGLGAGDGVSFMGVLPGQGARLGGDEDGDSVLDGDDPDGRVYNGAPKIVRQPGDRAVPPGGTLVLSVEAAGVDLEYEWRYNDQPVQGGDGAVLTRTGMSVAEAGEYVVVVTSPMGEVTSRKVKVEVYPAPGITVQPVARRIVRGQTTSLSVTATGEGLSYQWRRGSLPVQGATSRTLSFPNAQGTDSGDYSVVVSNGAGSVTSEVVRLTVVVPPIMTMTSLPAAIVGQPYSVPLTGAREPTRFVMTGLPRGLAVAKSGMELVGRAQQAGIFPLRVQGSNAAGTSAAVTMFLEVKRFPQGAEGVYEGVLPRHEALNGNLGGFVQVTTSRLASFSGTLQLGAMAYPLRGTWTASNTEDPRVTLTVNRRGLSPLEVVLGIDPDTRLLSGKVSAEGQEVVVTGGGAMGTPGVLAGNHSMAMLVPEDEEGVIIVPQGDGVGGFTVSSTGLARGVLVLADGLSFSFSAPMTEGGRIRIFKRLYEGAKTGSLHGRLRLTAMGGHRMEGSELSWWKGAQVKRTRSYAGGFGPLEMRVKGGLYVIPMRGATLPGLGRLEVKFSEGAAPMPGTRLDVASATLPGVHPAKIVVVGANPGSVLMTVQPGSGTRFTAGTTGSFAGSFLLEDVDTTQAKLPILKRKATFRGMMVDDGTGLRGYGYFLLPEMPAVTPVVTTLTSSPIRSGRVRVNGLP
jgi:DNA-binding beta-propeller fold protein YncE